MFGYITICKPELKVKDYYQYKGYYCGLCRTLKEKYGSVGQMTLTYDMTFLVLVLTSLYESETHMSTHRCKVHPVKKIPMLQNEMSEYAADLNILLTYYHFIDDWKDDKSIAGLTGTHLLNRQVRKISEKYKRQAGVIQKHLHQIQILEKEDCQNIDLISGCFGKLMGELFVYRQDRWEETLRRFGFFLGKFIYLSDAYEDLKEDQIKNRYNPLKELYKKDSYEEACYEILTMMMAECSQEFEKLPCLLDAEIIRNIIYSGVWTTYRKIQKERLEEKSKEKEENYDQ